MVKDNEGETTAERESDDAIRFESVVDADGKAWFGQEVKFGVGRLVTRTFVGDGKGPAAISFFELKEAGALAGTVKAPGKDELTGRSISLHFDTPEALENLYGILLRFRVVWNEQIELARLVKETPVTDGGADEQKSP